MNYDCCLYDCLLFFVDVDYLFFFSCGGISKDIKMELSHEILEKSACFYRFVSRIRNSSSNSFLYFTSN